MKAKKKKTSLYHAQPPASPYWNDQVVEWSGRLWMSGIADILPCARPRTSWYSDNITHEVANLNSSHMTSFSSSTATEDHPVKKVKVREQLSVSRGKRQPAGFTRTIQIRVYPNERQGKLLREWFGCVRLVYNMIVRKFNDTTSPFRYGILADFRALSKERIESGVWDFMKKVPFDVLD
jgi:hypothetical protein